MKDPRDMLAKGTAHDPRLKELVEAFYSANYYYQEGIAFFSGSKMEAAEKRLEQAIIALRP